MVPWPRFTRQLSFLKKQACAEQPEASPDAGQVGAGAWGGGARKGLVTRQQIVPSCVPSERAVQVEGAWQKGLPLPAEQTLGSGGGQCLMVRK